MTFRQDSATDISANETIILHLEVIAKNSHIAQHGSKVDDFEAVANSMNENKYFAVLLDSITFVHIKYNLFL